MERTSWPTRWTQALYPAALFLKCPFCSLYPHEEPLQGCSLERAMCYETIWTIYRTEPQRVSKETLKTLVGRCGDLLVLQSPRKASSLITTATYQPGVLCLSLWSLLALCAEAAGFEFHSGNS